MGDTRDNVIKDLEAGDQDKVNSPCSCKRNGVSTRCEDTSCASKSKGPHHLLTFGACPVGIKIRESSLVTDLLEGLWGLMIDLEDAARPPPTGAGAASVSVRHVEIDAASARRFRTRVVGDGALQQDWGRQLGGIEGVRTRSVFG